MAGDTTVVTKDFEDRHKRLVEACLKRDLEGVEEVLNETRGQVYHECPTGESLSLLMSCALDLISPLMKCTRQEILL